MNYWKVNETWLILERLAPGDKINIIGNDITISPAGVISESVMRCVRGQSRNNLCEFIQRLIQSTKNWLEVGDRCVGRVAERMRHTLSAPRMMQRPRAIMSEQETSLSAPNILDHNTSGFTTSFCSPSSFTPPKQFYDPVEAQDQTPISNQTAGPESLTQSETGSNASYKTESPRNMFTIAPNVLGTIPSDVLSSEESTIVEHRNKFRGNVVRGLMGLKQLESTYQDDVQFIAKLNGSMETISSLRKFFPIKDTNGIMVGLTEVQSTCPDCYYIIDSNSHTSAAMNTERKCLWHANVQMFERFIQNSTQKTLFS